MTRSRPDPSDRLPDGRLETLAAMAVGTGPDGEADDSTASADERPLRQPSPFTGDPLRPLPAATEADVDRAVGRARTAQSEWAERPLSDRTAVLDRVATLALDRRRALCDLVQAETGKEREGADTEVWDAVANANYYATNAAKLLRSRRRAGAIPGVTRTTEHRHPVGVVGLVTPWNYPLTLVVSDALPALVAGNAVVIKPAEATPYTALAARELLLDAGVPRDCVQMVPGRGETAGAALVERADFVGFTGSTAVGREVAATAGRRLVDASLELGGKNPMVVLGDADVDAAVQGAVAGCFANAGQLCVSIERIYVDDTLYEEFRDAFVAATRAQTLGVDFSYDHDVGSLVGPEQLDRVRSAVDDAVADGATVLTGGRHRPDVGPYVYEPTLLEGADHDDAIVQTETFGPVVTLHAVSDEEAAIERANDTPYGLHASVWTGDATRGERVGRRIDAGTVSVNDAYISAYGAVDAPMGGRGDSGLGRRHGRDGLRKYTEAQTVATSRAGALALPSPPLRGVAARLSSAALRANVALSRLARRLPFGGGRR